MLVRVVNIKEKKKKEKKLVGKTFKIVIENIIDFNKINIRIIDIETI